MRRFLSRFMFAVRNRAFDQRNDAQAVMSETAPDALEELGERAKNNEFGSYDAVDTLIDRLRVAEARVKQLEGKKRP